MRSARQVGLATEAMPIMKQGMFAKHTKKILIARVNIPPNEPCTTIVCGVERGGTSMVAGVLGELGIDMGPIGLNHEDPNFLFLEKAQLQTYIYRRNEEKCRWGFKYPRAHIDNRINEMKFRNPVWVFVFRNVVSNIDSLVARGSESTLLAYERIVKYYIGMLDKISDESSNYVLVSYERAVAESKRFATELAALFDLRPDLATIQLATKQVTGEGGGYLPASRHYHLVKVLPPQLVETKFSMGCMPLARVSYLLKDDVEINFQDEEVQQTQEYIVQYKEGYNKVVTIIFDFGEGFTGSAAYHLPLNGDNTLVRVQHKGAVRRIGFCSRRGQLPSSVHVLRCPVEAQANNRRLVIPADYPWQNVSTIVADKDRMLGRGGSDQYLSVGVSAFRNIAAALKTNGIDSVSTILDLPCGYGRVARVLRAAFPSAELSVSDLDTDGVAFCTEQFDAKPLISRPNFATLTFERTFDLIWAGSLITHLPLHATADFISFVLRHLSPGGVAVVSSHGALVADRIAGGRTYGIDSGAACRMVYDYQTQGYGYADYPRTDRSAEHYGISIATRAWVTSAITGADGKVLFYKDHAWDNHHDIVAFVRGG
jgi:SAM-dependent methyltransferase